MTVVLMPQLCSLTERDVSSTVENQSHSASPFAFRSPSAPWSRPFTSRQLEDLLSGDGPLSEERRAELRSHPEFPAAARRTAACLAAHHRGNRILNAIISDRGRFFAALFVLDLHFRRRDEGIGLTPGRLKELCVEQGICSATRAGALLGLMQLAGYVEAAPQGRDGRRRELVPTERLIGQQRARWRCYLVGAEPLVPAASAARRMLDHPPFVEGVVRLMSGCFRAGFRFSDHAPGLRLFTERNGGMFVLLTLFAASGDDADAPVDISVSQLARAISSSRAHVVKLLRDAETEGLLRRQEPGGIVLTPDLRHDTLEFFAFGQLMLIHFADTARAHFGM